MKWFSASDISLRQLSRGVLKIDLNENHRDGHKTFDFS